MDQQHIWETIPNMSANQVSYDIIAFIVIDTLKRHCNDRIIQLFIELCDQMWYSTALYT